MLNEIYEKKSKQFLTHFFLTSFSQTTNNTNPIRQEWNSGEEALTDALKLETQVTRSIRDIITTCENQTTTSVNDYHVSSSLKIVVMFENNN